MLISSRKKTVESEPSLYAATQHSWKASNWVDEQLSHNSSIGSILPGLTDDVAMICLARVSRKHLPVMGAVCKKWRSLIQSKDFSFVRKETSMVEEWLYFFTTRFDESRSHWEVMSSAQVEVRKIPPMPGSVNAGFCTVVLDGKLLVLGGFLKEIGLRSATADVHQYDSRLNSWSTLAKMKFVRYKFACCEVNRLIYAVGGYGSDGYELSAAEVYDPDKNEWTLIEELWRPRYRCFGCSLVGKLYVMGGLSSYNLNYCRHVDVYNPDGRSWCVLKSGICDTVTTHVVLGKKLFCLLCWEMAIGIFDPADNSWTKVKLPDVGISSDSIQLGILGNKLMLFSLHDDPYYETVSYDPAAPPGSEWCWSALRASGACLCTVTIEA